MSDFGRNLRRLREERQCHMRDLASHINVSVPYLSDIELGRRKPPQDEILQKIANFLEIDIASLEVGIAKN